SEWDTLQQQHALLSSRLYDLRQGSEVHDLEDQIDALRGQRLEAPASQRADLANQITALEAERDRLDQHLKNGGITPAIQQTQEAVQALDYRMRDLGPAINRAYEDAAAGQLAPEPPAIAPEAAPVAEEAPAATPTPEPEQIALAPPQAPAEASPIAQDVAKQLVTAGRPQEEADAVGALIADRYATRAALFNGAKGTAEDLYKAEGPQIVAGEVGGRGGMAAGKTAINDAKATVTLFQKADASTFIHETGHQWLEELMRDAADERAMDQVRTDAAIVRDWLGVGENEVIPRRAHEKFARGFERYMMEGHAPSAQLASVFAKFKDWLTQIYQTVNRLRSPINDDIRDVFNRMLSHPDLERNVIAPERETDFATRHEALAEHTEPA